jgi:hypothetical protein
MGPRRGAAIGSSASNEAICVAIGLQRCLTSSVCKEQS